MSFCAWLVEINLVSVLRVVFMNVGYVSLHFLVDIILKHKFNSVFMIFFYKGFVVLLCGPVVRSCPVLSCLGFRFFVFVFFFFPNRTGTYLTVQYATVSSSCTCFITYRAKQYRTVPYRTVPYRTLLPDRTILYLSLRLFTVVLNLKIYSYNSNFIYTFFYIIFFSKFWEM